VAKSCDLPVGPAPSASANDNSRTPPFGSALRIPQYDTIEEIEMGNGCTQAVTDLVSSFSADDLSGPRLLHAARVIARAIYRNASAKTRDTFGAFVRGDTDVLIVHDLFAVPNNLEPTPNDCSPSLQSRLFALGVAGLTFDCGHQPCAVSNENHGLYDRHVRSTAGKESEPSSAGGAEIGPHTEHSSRYHGDWGQFSPQIDTICLAGLRNIDNEPTGFAALEEVLRYLPEKSISALLRPDFAMAPPDSTDTARSASHMPILYRRNGLLESAYRADKVGVPPIPEARQAIDDLNSAIHSAARSVILRPGTACIARNPRCYHWRDKVKNPSRWLVRGFGIAPSTAAIFSNPDRPDLVHY